MDDAPFVRGFERIGDLSRDGEGLIERNWSVSDTIRQRRAVD